MYFFLLVLRILLNLSPNIDQKQSRFSKTLCFKFVLSKKDNTIAFNLSFVLLSAEVDLIQKKQGFKKDTFKACDTDRIKIILLLSTKNGSTLYTRSYSTSWDFWPWESDCGMRSSLEASHILGFRQIILGLNWWLFAGLHLYTYPAGLEQEWELNSELAQGI